MLALLVYHLHKAYNVKNDEDYMQKYGTFFEEFKFESSKYCLFYLLFVLRRLVLVFLIVFIKSEITQLYVSLFCSLAVRYI